MSCVSGFLFIHGRQRQLQLQLRTETDTSRASLGMDGTRPEMELETLGNLRFSLCLSGFGGHQKEISSL